MIYDLDAINIF